MSPREYGILFQDEMVRALHRPIGDPLRKTVTRRTSGQWAKRRPGDRLWVRECWAPDAEGPTHAHYRADLVGFTPTEHAMMRHHLDGRKWRPSLLMPRWASRMTLEVVSVEREVGWEYATARGMHRRILPAVNDAEARLEGVVDRAAYLALWRAINKDDVPDHLWRIEFREVPRG